MEYIRLKAKEALGIPKKYHGIRDSLIRGPFEIKWDWKMDYCRKNNLPPAQSWAWNEADKAYENHIVTKKP